MEMTESVGKASRAWDEQSLDLRGAAKQVGDAGTSGFTSPVAGTARTFLSNWNTHITAIADDSEGRADGLRDTMADWLATDGQSATDSERLSVAVYLSELR